MTFSETLPKFNLLNLFCHLILNIYSAPEEWDIIYLPKQNHMTLQHIICKDYYCAALFVCVCSFSLKFHDAKKLDGLVGLLVLKDQKLFCFNQKGYITLTGLGELFLKALEN